HTRWPRDWSSDVCSSDLPLAKPLRRSPDQAPYQLKRIHEDTYAGMFFSNVVAWFIMLSVGATVHASGVHDIGTPEQAAAALRPRSEERRVGKEWTARGWR